jgi:hypothetical protein
MDDAEAGAPALGDSGDGTIAGPQAARVAARRSARNADPAGTRRGVQELTSSGAARGRAARRAGQPRRSTCSSADPPARGRDQPGPELVHGHPGVRRALGRPRSAGAPPTVPDGHARLHRATAGRRRPRPTRRHRRPDSPPDRWPSSRRRTQRSRRTARQPRRSLRSAGMGKARSPPTLQACPTIALDPPRGLSALHPADRQAADDVLLEEEEHERDGRREEDRERREVGPGRLAERAHHLVERQ